MSFNIGCNFFSIIATERLMKPIILKKLLDQVETINIIGPQTRTVDYLTFDSRQIQTGGLFVALQGKYHDGHQFLNTAYDQGAMVTLGQQSFTPPSGKIYVRVPDSRRALSQLAANAYQNPTERLWTVGITGTKGKTSVSHLCAHLLDKACCLSTVTNLEHNLWNTTPESLDLHRLANDALQAGDRQLVLEVSSHALQFHRVADVDFDVTVFTNLSQDHFDDFDGFEPYFEAKTKLFVDHPKAQAVINIDDDYGKKLIQRLNQTVITFGFDEDAMIRAKQVQLYRDHSQFEIATPTGSFSLKTALPGKFNIYNLLAAASVGYWNEMPFEQIKQRLESVSAIEGRFERLKTAHDVHVVVDFAHSPDSLEQMVGFLKAHYPRLITVFGCGGESDPYKRPIMGQISGQLSNYTILTHDNPKKEDPMSILNQTEMGLRKATNQYEIIPERAEAIQRAIALATPGDCVLVAGKGHETYQEFGQHMIDFNDVKFLIDACGASMREVVG